MNFEMRIGDLVCKFVSLYRSPNQSLEEFDKFADNLEINSDTIAKKPIVSIAFLGDHNVKSSTCYENESKAYDGTKIDSVTSQFRMEMLTNEPNHKLPAASSCIDLVFVSQPNLVMELGFHFFFNQRCCHQIIYA